MNKKESVRDQLIKIAYENPELRADLIPVIKTASLADIAQAWHHLGPDLQAGSILLTMLLASAFGGMFPEQKTVSVPRPPSGGEEIDPGYVGYINKEFAKISEGVPDFGEHLKKFLKSHPDLKELPGWDMVEKTEFTSDNKGLRNLVGLFKVFKENKGKNKNSDKAFHDLILSDAKAMINHINRISAVLENNKKHEDKLLPRQ